MISQWALSSLSEILISKRNLTARQSLVSLVPMVIVHRMQGGAYILAELNGAVSRLQYAAFHIIPYLAMFPDCMPVTALMDEAELEDVQIHSESFPLADDPSEGVTFNE